ncbi:hypothetical protein MIND_01123300 [Mycena indigotica]|uniref:Mug135-like C-terminal domain-containing protein n=1 Tax=Mycena indigotica TaxID=2126181 RepID=A0A8H6S5W0_9AGAR|nr:uncharacterized protein MIND_01122300 [Mycena indigotica]XP_037215612.1 uncharacterized protein MIND_01122400 [Mycena indigotica]XP_037215619.1 uncharacterized protein MIND_01123300 [Mycena indigotica]KAF7293448.1 hypothetical protein MIND_01122300 [Mycena indigotica]KAF7293449.1 hypothetical protein MIND_01122400 [Mycena indigotica]KAF7293456.1 hypothetical protein MIND_01123300 [Mycena indigotica]
MAAINPPPLIPGMAAPPALVNPPTVTDAKVAEEYHIRIATQCRLHVPGFTDQMYIDSKIYSNEVLAAVALNAVPQNVALAGAPLWAQQLNARMAQVDQNVQQTSQQLQQQMQQLQQQMQQLGNRFQQITDVVDDLKLIVIRASNIIKCGGAPGNALEVIPVLDPVVGAVVNPDNLSAAAGGPLPLLLASEDPRNLTDAELQAYLTGYNLQGAGNRAIDQATLMQHLGIV